MSREDQFNVTATVTSGVPGAPINLGTFDTKTGGEVDSDESKHRPGNMGAQVALGGYVNVGNVTIGRMFDLTRDAPLRPMLRAAVGKADITVTVQHLTVEGAPTGAPEVYTGKVKTFTLPDHDSNSTDAAKFEMEISSANMTVV